MQSPRLVSSYAVSPQTHFTCPPCALRHPRQQTGLSRRTIYASVNSPKPKLQCYSESFKSKFAQGREVDVKSKDLDQSRSPVTHLDVLLSESVEEDHETHAAALLAIHEDGEIRCLSEDLDLEHWKTHIAPGSPQQNEGEGAGLHVDYASLITIEQGQKALLKDREDLLAEVAILNGGNAGRGSLLAVITRASMAKSPAMRPLPVFRLLHVMPSRTKVVARDIQNPLTEIFSTSLPTSEDLLTDGTDYDLHAAGGSLSQRSANCLTAYSLTGLNPHIQHRVPLDGEVSSSLRLSPSSVALGTAHSIMIMDVNYRSVQAETSSSILRKTSKNTEIESSAQPPTRLISHFAPLDMIVALQGRKLIASHLAPMSSSFSGSGKRKRKRNGLLLNSIGHGESHIQKSTSERQSRRTGSTALGTYAAVGFDRAWEAKRSELDKYLLTNKLEAFEETMASELGLSDGKMLLLGHQDTIEDQSIPSLEKIHYLLSILFVPEIESEGIRFGTEQVVKKLKIPFLPRVLFRWLAMNGLVSSGRIEEALKQTGAIPITAKLDHSAFIEAIFRWDSGFEFLCLVLESPVPLQAAELVHCLHLFLETSNALAGPGKPLLLTYNEASTHLTSEDGSDGQMQLDGADDTTKDDERPLRGNAIDTIHALNATLKRLCDCSSNDITQALKCELSHPELRSLVDLLRIELARGGWLMPYTQEAHDDLPDTANETNDRANIITKLLNCAIACIGSGGWILGSSSADDLAETADTIAYMKAEISAALEGIEEATYLKGILGEMLLYGKNASHSSSKALRSTGRDIQQVSLAPWDIEEHALPIGIKAGQRTSTRKVGAGGELIERSARDLGQMKSKMVGRYSFERIMI